MIKRILRWVRKWTIRTGLAVLIVGGLYTFRTELVLGWRYIRGMDTPVASAAQPTTKQVIPLPVNDMDDGFIIPDDKPRFTPIDRVMFAARTAGMDRCRKAIHKVTWGYPELTNIVLAIHGTEHRGNVGDDSNYHTVLCNSCNSNSGQHLSYRAPDLETARGVAWTLSQTDKRPQTLDVGCMQINLQWQDERIAGRDMFNPEQNVMVAIEIIEWCIEHLESRGLPPYSPRHIAGCYHRPNGDASGYMGHFDAAYGDLIAASLNGYFANIEKYFERAISFINKGE